MGDEAGEPTIPTLPGGFHEAYYGKNCHPGTLRLMLQLSGSRINQRKTVRAGNKLYIEVALS